MKVCVDAGHGSKDHGAIGFDPFYVEEKTVDLAIAFELETEFLTHPDQLLFLTDPVRQAEMAAAIAAGIDRLSNPDISRVGGFYRQGIQGCSCT
jgi:N-acetylmuramoyl-L-alanine amidase